jgi:CheY-like chemotaxis protein/anti-sigma regulatory factor (Ser/Thr protein kinase)
MVPVHLDEVVQRACRMAKTEIRHRARLVLDLRTRRPVTGDHGKLTQLVTNLVVNAAHAIVEGQADCNQISVTTQERGDTLVLVVEDTGQGIPADLRERIFEPFFTTKPAGRGGGLGLAVCMDIARLHQGTIRVDSELGRGSRFEVCLPLHDGLAAPPPIESPAAATSPPPTRGRLLLIDDDALVLRGLGRLLSLSHEVVLAHGGQEGLEVLLHDRDFDAILCDLMMPVTDGPEVHAVIARRAPELLPRLAFCSGGAFTPRVRAFVDSVDNLVLGKPIRRAELLHALDTLIARGRRGAARRV